MTMRSLACPLPRPRPRLGTVFHLVLIVAIFLSSIHVVSLELHQNHVADGIESSIHIYNMLIQSDILTTTLVLPSPTDHRPSRSPLLVFP